MTDKLAIASAYYKRKNKKKQGMVLIKDFLLFPSVARLLRHKVRDVLDKGYLNKYEADNLREIMEQLRQAELPVKPEQEKVKP